MINMKNPKAQEAVQGIHEALLRKVKKGGQVKEDIVMENRIFSILCQNFDIEPRKCAIRMNERYGYDMTGDEVIQIFRYQHLSYPKERRELLEWAGKVADCFAGAMEGKRDAYDRLEAIRKEGALKSGKKHETQERIAVLMIFEKYPEIDLFDDGNSLHLLGNTLARYFFYDMVDAVSEAHGFPQYWEEKKKRKGAGGKEEKKMSYEQALHKIAQLENSLERTNTMLQDLQDEFEEQLEASKVKELADFFARLNSEKYGCILDELLMVRKGVDALRKSGYELPIEINGLFIMIKKMIQFVRDSHIEPMMKINSLQEVSASDVEFCNYEGSPFTDPDERKTVKVVSPGWVYKDKELQISRPKVKEDKE